PSTRDRTGPRACRRRAPALRARARSTSRPPRAPAPHRASISPADLPELTQEPLHAIAEALAALGERIEPQRPARLDRLHEARREVRRRAERLELARQI